MTSVPARSTVLALATVAALVLVPISAVVAAPATHASPTALRGIGVHASDIDPSLNDTFALAAEMESLPQSFISGTLVGATLESKEPTSIQTGKPAKVGGSVWAKWKAPASGVVTAWTFGSTADTTLAIFTGSKMSTAKRLAVNDNDPAAGSSPKQSRLISVPVTAGTTYRIQIGYQAATTPSTFSLTIRAELVPASNDDRGHAIDKSSHTTWTTSSATYASTIEHYWEPTSNPERSTFKRGRSLWYKYTPSVGGLATVTTVGSNSDTYLAVFRSSAGEAFTEIAFSDEGSGIAPQSSIGSLLMEPNFTYYIQAGHVTYPTETEGYENTLKVNFSITTQGPVISKVSPASGPQAGGTKITITGSRLGETTDVTVNGSAATDIIQVSSTKVTAIAPASATKGKYYVQIFTGYGQSKYTSKGYFTYK